MESLFKHWHPFLRKFPAPFQVIATGSLREKDHWVGYSFEQCNFSLILRGHGTYRRKDRIWSVQAPCVFIQLPGEYLGMARQFRMKHSDRSCSFQTSCKCSGAVLCVCVAQER